MNEQELEALLEEVKEFLNFTWDDPGKEKKLKSFILSSNQYLCEVAGEESIDFTKDYLAKDLLLNRVLYMDSQALDDFASNYNGMLLELKIKYAK